MVKILGKLGFIVSVVALQTAHASRLGQYYGACSRHFHFWDCKKEYPPCKARGTRAARPVANPDPTFLPPKKPRVEAQPEESGNVPDVSGSSMVPKGTPIPSKRPPVEKQPGTSKAPMVPKGTPIPKKPPPSEK